jgi:hypothetical protein
VTDVGGVGDDRRKLDRDVAGMQPPAPVIRPTPPEELLSRAWAVTRTLEWYLNVGRTPRENVARALRQHEVDRYVDEPPYEPWDELDPIVQEDYLEQADVALNAVAPLLRGPLFRSVAARRDAELRHALATTTQLAELLDDEIARNEGRKES